MHCGLSINEIWYGHHIGCRHNDDAIDVAVIPVKAFDVKIHLSKHVNLLTP